MPDMLDYPEVTPAPQNVTSTFPDADEGAVPDIERHAVAMWLARIVKAKARWEPDFDRMRMNQEFAYGFQWNEQQLLDDDRYISNVVLKAINRGVAKIYARNPKVEAQRRPRRDFVLYDGKLETIQNMLMRAMNNPMDFEAQAVLADFEHGMLWRQQVEDVGDTLGILYQYMVDTQRPSFKKQLKKLVRRVRTCGVGYAKLNFERLATGTDSPLTSTIDTSMQLRAKRCAFLLQQVSEGKLDTDSPLLEDVNDLINSLMYSAQEGEQDDIAERLVFDFPRATSIIPDWRCQSIEDFEGCHWVAEEYVMPLNEVNAFFGTDISVGGDVSLYQESGEPLQNRMMPGTTKESPELALKPLVALYQVYDMDTKSSFYVVKGWPAFVRRPSPLTPCTRRFWPLFSLTFNAVEMEPGLRGSCFPPSDVQLMKSPQKERNRSRQAWRKHRRANAPRWLAAAGGLDADSKKRLMLAREHDVVEVNEVGGNSNLQQLVTAVPTQPMDPALYETASVENDILYAAGAQQADLGPAQADVTATVGSIAAQAQATETASEVDDIDEFLSDMAEAGGEMLLKECSYETVIRVVGNPVWPTDNRRDYISQLYLTVKSGSSGRPNKAIEMSNWQIAAPMLQQAGANPMFMVRETLKRLDDNVDPEDAFPLVPTGNNQQSAAAQPPGPPQQIGQGNGAPGPMPNGMMQGATPGPAPKAPLGNPKL